MTNSKCRIPTGTRGHMVRMSKSGWRSTEFLRVRFGWGEVSFRPGRTATGFRSAVEIIAKAPVNVKHRSRRVVS